jgi:ornithine cyclodeaminase/alanine dehydrogenase
MIYLADATNGSPLAIMDSIYITMQRTGAATAVAAKYCARPDASVVTLCGAGRQGRIQLMALTKVRVIRAAYVWSPHYDEAERYAAEMSDTLGIEIMPVARLEDGTRQSDIVVTCTPARAPFLHTDALRPGTFVAAVGADSPDKQELDVAVLASAHKVVTDITAQCAHVGELHHAITTGRMTADDIHGEIGDVITGVRSGRERDDEIIVFDSTGTALQDVACAAAIYERAIATHIGTSISLA